MKEKIWKRGYKVIFTLLSLELSILIIRLKAKSTGKRRMRIGNVLGLSRELWGIGFKHLLFL